MLKHQPNQLCAITTLVGCHSPAFTLFARVNPFPRTRRRSLALVYLLVDSSIPPQNIDLRYAEWLWRSRLPFALVFTKVWSLVCAAG